MVAVHTGSSHVSVVQYKVTVRNKQFLWAACFHWLAGGSDKSYSKAPKNNLDRAKITLHLVNKFWTQWQKLIWTQWVKQFWSRHNKIFWKQQLNYSVLCNKNISERSSQKMLNPSTKITLNKLNPALKSNSELRKQLWT